MKLETDILVIGSGVAGLSFALRASEFARVTVVTKRSRTDSATNWAQGGIAAVLDPEDSFAAHIDDTLKTGGGLSHPDVVDFVIRNGPARVKELMALGAEFSRTQAGDVSLTREGGHSARRVLHAGDMTGREVQRALVHSVAQRDNIEVIENHMAVDLIEVSKFQNARDVQKRVAGAYVLNEESGEVHAFIAKATVLAAGGAGKVYLYTSNPDVATGDGVAMAYRAGAEIANMEFFQFHPTTLFHPHAKSFLISEALRGEGGVLRLPDDNGQGSASGHAFMADHHAMKDLAPRDVVARAIDYEMKKAGFDCVYLDMSAHDGAFLKERFSGIHQACLKFGVDMTVAPIPVVPAAHYMCGGVVVDQKGRTSIEGLYALGEVSCTGLHGANRLASNSLLEGLVYGHEVAERISETYAELKSSLDKGHAPEWDVGQAVPSDEAVVVSNNWDELRRFMWNYVGIVRGEKRLTRAVRRIDLLQEEIREYYWQHLVNRDMLELRNIADVAELIVKSALFRKESRGLHFTLDHQKPVQSFSGDTVISKGQAAVLRPIV